LEAASGFGVSAFADSFGASFAAGSAFADSRADSTLLGAFDESIAGFEGAFCIFDFDDESLSFLESPRSGFASSLACCVAGRAGAFAGTSSGAARSAFASLSSIGAAFARGLIRASSRVASSENSSSASCCAFNASDGGGGGGCVVRGRR
jgi:hypothetical protein